MIGLRYARAAVFVSVGFVLVFPVVAYFAGNWSAYYEASPRAVYGPSTIGEVAVIALHDAMASPPWQREQVAWDVHLDEAASGQVRGVRIAYGTDAGPGAVSSPMSAIHSWQWSGELPPPASDAFMGGVVHVWIEITFNDGRLSRGSFDLGPAKASRGR